jgi:2-polyprenyl-3-methyl-5-hydroxy-6-metoxy-1,4-benzoquinol methylase
MEQTVATYQSQTFAHYYDALLRQGALIHDFVLPRLLDLIGKVAHLRVCDLACGQGIVARELAARRAQVVGVDRSQEMLALAEAYEARQPLGIHYVRDDAQTLCTVRDASFDGVVCNMALPDIADLQALAQAIARVLAPGGWLVFSLPHPCFHTPDSRWAQDGRGPVAVIRRYFAEGFWTASDPHRFTGLVGAYHRTLSTYLNTFAEVGLVLRELREPRATATFAVRKPGYREVPGVLLARCKKWYCRPTRRERGTPDDDASYPSRGGPPCASLRLPPCCSGTPSPCRGVCWLVLRR